MKFKVTTVQIVEVALEGKQDIDDFKDSLMDTLLDQQGEDLATSDGKFDYVPSDIITLSMESVEE